MRKITLRFPDEDSLREFIKTIKDTSIQINFSKLLLTCNCGEAEIELAQKGFNATIIHIQTKIE